MDTEAQASKQILIYPPRTDLVSDFWRDKYEKDAKKYWETFYKRNTDKFFKDRHYLHKEWGNYFEKALRNSCSGNPPVISDGNSGHSCAVLEIGCGVGNSVFPLLETYPNLFIYASDFSAKAIDLLKAHKDYIEEKIHAFVCDVTCDDLTSVIPVHSIDIVTLVFCLSAISPQKMPFVLRNIKKVLKSTSHVLVRDYASGDLAQERLSNKLQKISDNFYVRSDGTRAYYFTEGMLHNLFKSEGFNCEAIKVHERKIENRAREITMNRRWIQGVFSNLNSKDAEDVKLSGLEDIDLSEGVASEIFGVPELEVMPILINGNVFQIRTLPKEYQHSCKATGLMLWESARFLANLLASNSQIIVSKKVLELGCGSVGICSIIASTVADLVVASDGDSNALALLADNVKSNRKIMNQNTLQIEHLEWGCTEHIEKVHMLTNRRGFDVIIGSDVTYVAEAVPLLFATAKALMAEPTVGKPDPLLILCHVERHVNELDILSSARNSGFTLHGKWPEEIYGNQNDSLKTLTAPLFPHGLGESESVALIRTFCFKHLDSM